MPIQLRPLPSWLDSAVIYQIYPQSFQDSNGDGIGDLPGITSRLDYIASLGVDAVWINPIFESPFQDAGYRRIAPRYGTQADLERLITESNKRGIRILLDFVPGHTSIDHPWFKASAQSEPNAFSNYYVWTHNWWQKGVNAGFSSAREGQLYAPLDPASNRPNVEAQETDSESLLERVRCLIRWKKSLPALKASAPFEVLHLGECGYPLIYRRGTSPGNSLILVFNPAGTPAEVRITTALPGLESLRSCGVSFEDEGALCRCNPRSFGIFEEGDFLSRPCGSDANHPPLTFNA